MSSIPRACYVGSFLYVCGLVLLGAAFQYHLGAGALVIGWGLVQVASMLNTVGVCEYLC